MSMGVTGLALGGGTEYGSHVVVALDVSLLGEVQVTAIGLGLAGEGGLQIVFGLGAFQIRHGEFLIACS